MILSIARQWVREAIASQYEEEYKIGNTLLDTTIEANRSFLAENLRIEDVPLLEVREDFSLSAAQFGDTDLYLEIGLEDRTRVRTQIEIIDVANKVPYRAELISSQSKMQKLTETIAVGGVDQARDIIPIFRNGNVCQLMQSTGPDGGWTAGTDIAIISVIQKPTPLSDVITARRLKDDHELYALKLAYADLMLTLGKGDPAYKNIRTAILSEIGLQK